MRLFCLALACSLTISSLFAEGTKQLAPNGSITIAGNTTTDIAALHIGNPDFDNFATYTNTDPNNRLYVHVQDPSKECIYLGFSLGHRNVTSPNPPQISFEYRVKDPDGNIIYGPIIVNPADANIDNWTQAATGPMQIHGADGYDAMLISSADLMSAGWSGKGDFYIEFQASTGAPDFLIDFWDISVADCQATNPNAMNNNKNMMMMPMATIALLLSMFTASSSCSVISSISSTKKSSMSLNAWGWMPRWLPVL